MMFLKPLALAAVLVFTFGSAWAQEGNPRPSDARPERSGPTGSVAPRSGESRNTPTADGSGVSQGTPSRGTLDAVVGNGTGRTDEDASAAAAR